MAYIMTIKGIDMKNISVSNDIIPVGEFKASLAKYLKKINLNRNSLIITQNGKPAGVLISPYEFDELRQNKLFIASVSSGILDSENKEIYSTSQIKNEMKKFRSRNKK